MKKRSLSLGGRPGPLSHAPQLQFPRSVPIPSDTAPRPINSLRAEVAQLADCGLQQDSQSKHPFLPRSGQPYSSQTQRSLSQGCLTQSEDTQQFSQNSQPEDYSYDQWTRLGFHEKEISLSQPKPPSPYFAGLTSSLNRRNSSGTVGGGSTPVSSTCASSALCLVGPQSNTPRPWPQCNVSEELEKRLGSLEKLREEETALLQKICDDYQQIKIFLEETCFESKDNRSKLALQQNALHKLLKEEETANSTILSAIKTSGEANLQDILVKFRQAAEEAEVANKSIVSANFESVREEIVNFKRDLNAELHEMKQSVPIESVHEEIENFKRDLKAELHEMKQSMPIESVREEIEKFKRDLKAELHEMKQSVPIESLREEIENFKRDLKAELHEMKQSVPIGGIDPQLPNRSLLTMDMHHHHPNQSSDSRTELTESTPKHYLDKSSLPISMSKAVDHLEVIELSDSDLPNRSSLPISTSNVVDLDEFPVSDLDTGLAFLARGDTYPAYLDSAKRRNRLEERYKLTYLDSAKRKRRLEERYKIADEYSHKSVRAKMLRAQRRVHYGGMC